MSFPTQVTLPVAVYQPDQASLELEPNRDSHEDLTRYGSKNALSNNQKVHNMHSGVSANHAPPISTQFRPNASNSSINLRGSNSSMNSFGTSTGLRAKISPSAATVVRSRKASVFEGVNHAKPPLLKKEVPQTRPKLSSKVMLNSKT